MATLTSGDITVIVEPTGPTMEDAERVRAALGANDRFVRALGTSNYRILDVSFPDADGKGRPRRRSGRWRS